jgi:glycosyltransferase involved in cell wall biosynthesis
MLLVEGAIGGGYEMGLETAVELVDRLNHTQAIDRPVELMVVGRISPTLQANWQARASFPLRFTGIVPGNYIPELDRSAHLLYSADLNAACPNAAIEALACGLPVVGFDTGALPELVAGDAGRVVPYGGNVWKLDPPDVPALAAATAEILRDQHRFQHAARLRAEQVFGLDKMVDSYLAVLSESVDQ